MTASADSGEFGQCCRSGHTTPRIQTALVLCVFFPDSGLRSLWWRQELLDANPLHWRRNVLPLDIGQRRLYFDDQSMERCVTGPHHLHPIAGLKLRLELPQSLRFRLPLDFLLPLRFRLPGRCFRPLPRTRILLFRASGSFSFALTTSDSGSGAPS